MNSIGSLIGCFLTGAVLDRLPRYLFIASMLVVLGVSNSCLPYSPSLAVMYAICLVRGLVAGSIDTAGNVTLLKIWAGRDSGPYMHALHFSFGIGAFLAPVISRPFLGNMAEVAGGHMAEVAGGNSTEAVAEEMGVWTVKALYPLVGSFAVLISLAFVVLHIKERKDSEIEGKEEVKSVEGTLSKGYTTLIVFMISILFFLYVGMEVAFGTYVSAFSVESKLQFTRQQVSAHHTSFLSPC